MYIKKDHLKEAKIKEAIEIKKALKEKELIPIEDDDALVDLNAVKLYENSDEEWEANDLFASDDLIRSIKERTNQRYQDHLEKYANPFPIHVFPQKVREFIIDAEKSLAANIEFLAAGVLCATSGAMGNKFVVELKRNMINTPCLYMAIVGSTGTNKTLPLQATLEPLYIIEKELSKKFEDAKKDADRLITEKRCIVNDCTMEAVLEILEHSDITVYHDELAGFLKSFNRYRSGGDDMEKWLSIWSGVQLRTDRKNNKGKLITRPFANIVGTIQPDVLLSFLSTNSSGNGFNERILFVTSDPKENAKWNSLSPNAELQDHYHKTIKTIYNAPSELDEDGNIVSKIIRYNETALKMLMDWQHKNAITCDKTSNNNLISIYKKLEIYINRFSLVMAIIDYAETKPSLLKMRSLKIQEKHVKAAIEVTEYFRNSAKRVLSFKPSQQNLTAFNPRLKAFIEKLPIQFTTQKALEVGAEMAFAERTVFYYLKSEFFKPLRKGVYRKKYTVK